jgi:hypothetical protein
VPGSSRQARPSTQGLILVCNGCRRRETTNSQEARDIEDGVSPLVASHMPISNADAGAGARKAKLTHAIAGPSNPQDLDSTTAEQLAIPTSDEVHNSRLNLGSLNRFQDAFRRRPRPFHRLADIYLQGLRRLIG